MQSSLVDEAGSASGKKLDKKTPKKAESTKKRGRSAKKSPNSTQKTKEDESTPVVLKTEKEESLKKDLRVELENLPQTAEFETFEAAIPVATAPEAQAQEVNDKVIREEEIKVEKNVEVAESQPIEHELEAIAVTKVEDDPALVSEPEKSIEKPAEVQESLEDVEIPLVGDLNDDVFMSAESETGDKTSMLADESIISVPDSPTAPKTPVAAEVRPRDSTFSPIVDASIHDSRPNIDLEPVKVAKPSATRKITAFGDDFQNDQSPVFAPAKISVGVATVALRTSTPYAKRLAQKAEDGTPKRSASKPMARAKTPSLILDKPTVDDVKINVLEKSILKSSKRKRSMSVADCESIAQKRVMFASPKITDISKIDEKMMASFIEEKENSIMRQAASGSRRKRSLSTGTPVKKPDSAQKLQSKVKIPNFKAIHELQFQKMESIAEHAARKAERAKKLATPVKEAEKKVKTIAEPEVKPAKPAFSFSSKIPTRRALATSAENVSALRTLKRSISENSDEPPQKKSTVTAKPSDGPSTSKQLKVAVVTGLQRSKSETVKQTPSWVAPVSSSLLMNGLKKKLMSSRHNESSQSVAQQNREKVEERRNRNISLYKQGSRAIDQRQKNTEMLKGVRLNRRFELQMQHRREHPETS